MRLPRLYPILDADSVEQRGLAPEQAAQAILDAGAGILQWRSKGLLKLASLEQVERIAELCRKRGALFIVNDRADVAMLAQAGLHVGQEDLPAGAARRLIGDGAVLGFSTHNPAQLRASESEPVDYVALGPIFATGTKKNPDPVVGLERLREWRGLTGRPLVAIGGITLETAPAVLEAGADSVAVIGGILPDDCTADNLRRRVEQWLFRIG